MPCTGVSVVSEEYYLSKALLVDTEVVVLKSLTTRTITYTVLSKVYLHPFDIIVWLLTLSWLLFMPPFTNTFS